MVAFDIELDLNFCTAWVVWLDEYQLLINIQQIPIALVNLKGVTTVIAIELVNLKHLNASTIGF